MLALYCFEKVCLLDGGGKVEYHRDTRGKTPQNIDNLVLFGCGKSVPLYNKTSFDITIYECIIIGLLVRL